MGRNIIFAATAALASLPSAIDAFRLFREARKTKTSLRAVKVSPAGVSFKTATEACCGCFRAKYQWAKSGGFEDTYAHSVTTCGTKNLFKITL